MPQTVIRVIDVYPYRLRDGAPQFLLFRRAPSVDYEGQWRMVGGRIDDEETAWQAALRELREETGREPTHFWTVPSINRFYEWQHDRINLIPAFAAELDADPVLNHEHDDFAWLDVDTAVSRLLWPEQRRLVQLTARMLRRGLPPELVVEL